MLRGWHLMAVAACAALAGCMGMNFDTVQRTNQLKVGMTEAEVIEAIGLQPDSRTVKDGRPALRFTLQEPWKGFIPYDMSFDRQGRLESWKADEEAYRRSQQLAGQPPAGKTAQKPPAAQPAPTPPPPTAGPNDAELQRWIAGKYMSYVGNTYRQLILSPKGTFRYNRESSYSGREGQVGGAWGAASQSGDSGTWTIGGTRDAGQIHLQYSGGARQDVSYRRGRENGVFTFDGVTFAYESAAE